MKETMRKAKIEVARLKKTLDRFKNIVDLHDAQVKKHETELARHFGENGAKIIAALKGNTEHRIKNEVAQGALPLSLSLIAARHSALYLAELKKAVREARKK